MLTGLLEQGRSLAGSPLRAALFDTYVASPSVAAVYREISAGS